MKTDWVIIGIPTNDQHERLLEWRAQTPMHQFVPDYHRLQLERWIWEHRERLAGRPVLDVGVETPRAWLGSGYVTCGQTATCDVQGDIHALPFADDAWDAVICTEVLEHVEDPVRAVRELHRVLAPGGLLLVTSPFLWPWHGKEGYYRDYWRFTHEGWGLLLKDFSDVKITACCWTEEGGHLYHILRQHEAWGWRSDVKGATGYLCTAVKGGG